MSGLGAHQIVTSIVRWPNDHIVRSKYLERIVENRRRQVRAIAIERDDPPPADSEVAKSRSESGREAFAFLRYDLDGVASQLCQFVLIWLRTHHRDLHAGQRLGQREGILQEAAIQGDDGGRGKTFCETRFDPARLWRLRHNDQRSARG